MDAISINRSISGSSCPILGEPSVSRVVMFVVDESCERELFFSYSIVCMCLYSVATSYSVQETVGV
jgi:hypothetical protein